ncbi:hypothetical protein DH09_00745 (plasmid) [Bacillaceae bacterium JMAK1]|nr:hypothetical protein DH09_00745 [Bacillaceae bacterium JMAK1]
MRNVVQLFVEDYKSDFYLLDLQMLEKAPKNQHFMWNVPPRGPPVIYLGTQKRLFTTFMPR